jgi:hypothetical protein
MKRNIATIIMVIAFAAGILILTKFTFKELIQLIKLIPLTKQGLPNALLGFGLVSLGMCCLQLRLLWSPRNYGNEMEMFWRKCAWFFGILAIVLILLTFC